MDRVAKTLDLFCDIGLDFVELLEGVGSMVSSKIIILNRSWVAIMINESPGSLVGFQALIWGISESDFLRWHNQFISLVSSLWLGSQESKNRNTTDSPVFNWAGEFFN